MKNYPEIVSGISTRLRGFRQSIGPTMQGFSILSQEAMKPGVLDTKTKEFIALAIGVAKRCDGCIGFHTQALIKAGATRQEFEEVLGVAIYMGGGPSLMYAADAMTAFEQSTPKDTPQGGG